MPLPRALFSWSSGKDSAWALNTLVQQGSHQVVGLLTTLSEPADRVAMHGVRHEILRRQADALGLPLHVVSLPSPCSNDEYQARMGAALSPLVEEERISTMVFGDLFLEDIRRYREQQLQSVGIEALFPLWGMATDQLAAEMIEGGLKARVSCVDSAQIPGAFSGRQFDSEMLTDLPGSADPCGENGEFHTVVWDAPMFSRPIELESGEQHVDGQFVFTDFTLAPA